MTDHEFQDELRRVLHTGDAAPRQLDETLAQAQREMRSRALRPSLSFGRFLAGQLRFIGWQLWLMQGLLLATVCGLTALSFGPYYLDNPRYGPMVLGCLAILVCLTALPFVRRSQRCKMREVEAATRFSTTRLLAAKLIIIAGGDLCLLGAILLTAVLQTPLPAGSVALYLLLPFLSAAGLCLFLLGRLSGDSFLPASVGLCSLLLIAFLSLYRFSALTAPALSPGWLVVCGVLLTFCWSQLRRLLRCGPDHEF